LMKRNGFFLQRFVVGPMAVNCYLLADPATKDACLIDPGAVPPGIKNILSKNGFQLRFIVNTHGHGDHIGANAHLNLPVYIHSLDADFLADAGKNLSSAFFFRVTSPEASKLLEDGDRIALGGLELEVLHTPGHTPGSVSLKIDGVVFTGDALFAGGIGRTDFPYGDEEVLMKSISQRLLTLGDGTVIYPGHGEPSTIGEEKRSNPFIT